MLFDGNGHAMSVKSERKKDGAVIWRCVKRAKPNACGGQVCQQGECFETISEHTCSVDKDILKKKEMNAKVNHFLLTDKLIRIHLFFLGSP